MLKQIGKGKKEDNKRWAVGKEGKMLVIFYLPNTLALAQHLLEKMIKTIAHVWQKSHFY